MLMEGDEQVNGYVHGHEQCQCPAHLLRLANAAKPISLSSLTRRVQAGNGAMQAFRAPLV